MFPRDVSLYTSKRLRDLILGKERTISIGKREREKREAAIPASQSGSANYEAEDRSVALSRSENGSRGTREGEESSPSTKENNRLNFVTPRSTELLLSGGGVKVVKVIDSIHLLREFGAIIALSSFSFFSSKEICPL